MDVFVTGGSGFVGRNLIRMLVAETTSVHWLAPTARKRSCGQRVRSLYPAIFQRSG